jgi:hypothetical protein
VSKVRNPVHLCSYANNVENFAVMALSALLRAAGIPVQHRLMEANVWVAIEVPARQEAKARLLMEAFRAGAAAESDDRVRHNAPELILGQFTFQGHTVRWRHPEADHVPACPCGACQPQRAGDG